MFAVAGALVVEAAVSYDAAKSTGLDGALRTLADRAYGPWLLGALALGLIAFGLYGLASASLREDLSDRMTDRGPRSSTRRYPHWFLTDGRAPQPGQRHPAWTTRQPGRAAGRRRRLLR